MSTEYRLILQSSAMFGTWIHMPSERICFDMGDGLASALRHKLIGIRDVLLSHGHRDHVAGLPMFLNVRLHHEGTVRIIHPAGMSMARELKDFAPRFERRAGDPGRVQWVAAEPGVPVSVDKKNHFIMPFETRHYRRPPDGRPQSLGYHLCLKKWKVRDEHRGLGPEATHALIREHGRGAVLREVEEKYLSYSGDTRVLPPETYADSKILLHEATFLTAEDRDADDSHEAKFHFHSSLEEVIELAMAANVGHLGLFHFSTRYKASEILDAIRAALRRYKPAFPVSAALPGRLVSDLLSRSVDPAGGDQAFAPAKKNEAPSPGEEEEEDEPVAEEALDLVDEAP